MGFRCEVCGYETPYEGVYYRHLVENRDIDHEKMLREYEKEKIGKAIDWLKSLIREVFGSEKDFIECFGREITLTDEAEGLDIYAYVSLNDWGIPKYYINIKIWDINEEIITPESCHDCLYEECDWWDEDKEECGLTDDIINKEIEEYRDKKVVILHNGEVVIRRWICDVECFLNFRHYHLYKGHLIGIETTDRDKVEAIIKAYDILIDVYESLIS